MLGSNFGVYDTLQGFEVPSGSLKRDCIEPGIRGFSLFIVFF